MKIVKLLSLLMFSFLMTVKGYSQVLSADFSYTWSWSNSMEILILDQIEGTYDFLLLDMGDGTTYSTTDVNHTYAEEGTYFINLKVSNSQNGLSDNKTIPVVVPNAGCNIVFSYEGTGNTGEIVFTPVSGYFFPIDGQLTWDFGDGTTVTGSSNQVHVYENPNQVYEVTLSLDGPNCDFSYTEAINPGAPTGCFADFTYEVISDDGMTIQFNDASFTASGASPSSVIWYFGEASNPSSTEFNPTFTYYDNGTYLVSYIIFDENGSCTDEAQMVVEVNGTPPLRANFFYVQPNFNNSEFNVVLVPIFTGNITNIEIDMGDGSPILTEVPDLYVYQFQGEFEICITVYDNDNNLSDTQCLPISLPWTGCNGLFISEAGEDPNVMSFTALYGSQPQPFLTYFWDFGDGTPIVATSEANITHIFPSDISNYNVTLTTQAADGLGNVFCTFDYSNTITAGGGTVTSITTIASIELLNVYPNPASGQFFIEFSGKGDEEVNIQMLDMLGRSVYNNTIDQQEGLNTFEVFSGDLPKGIYQLILRTDNQQRTTKLVVE